ncbi:hypothetical protein T459_01035 [Capsicum annuum]|uniref:Uncharacterized protein n=1 Tax=Capsicum annuum TaxID=4072 RepID=A0A2G3AG43_CAPAN|nr:hypothetical protein T459_01035 [Capsicum annuum]
MREKNYRTLKGRSISRCQVLEEKKNSVNVDKEKQLRSPDQMLSNKLRIIKQWAWSKRTGLIRNIYDKDNHRLSEGEMSIEVHSDNDVLPQTDSFMKRSGLLKSPRSSVCLPESSQRMRNMLLDFHILIKYDI